MSKSPADLKLVLGMWIAKGYVDWFDRFDLQEFFGISFHRTDIAQYHPPLLLWMLSFYMEPHPKIKHFSHVPDFHANVARTIGSMYTVEEQEKILAMLQNRKFFRLRG
jgi:hypothetical protein